MAYDATLDPRREALDRLLLVADALENPPEGLYYNQGQWKCGSHACAVGHALVKYENIGGLQFAKPEEYLFPLSDDDPKSEAIFQEAGLDVVFGLTPDEALEYFGALGPKDLRDLQFTSGPTRALAMAKSIRALHARKVAELQMEVYANAL